MDGSILTEDVKQICSLLCFKTLITYIYNERIITFRHFLKGEKWQYVVLPKNPSPSGDFADTPMGAIGFATSGGHFYNHLANPDGSVAWYDEIQSLDLSMGHSDPSGTYHYHGVSPI